MVSGTDGECSNEPEGTSDAEASDAAAEEIGKMKSNEKLTKNGNEEQKDIGSTQEVRPGKFT